MIITANCVVKNEIYWFPYGLASVLPHLDHVFITDTGSTDGTKEIIKDYFIPKFPNKITLIEKSPKSDNEFTHNFTSYKNELVQLSRDMKTDWMLCLDGDEVYYDFFFPQFKEKLETLDPIWRMIAVNTRYFITNLDYVFSLYTNFWHHRFFNLNKKGHWVLPYGDIDWGDPKSVQEERLTLEIIPNKIDMIHMSLVKRSPNDNQATARIRRQSKRQLMHTPMTHNFGLPEVLFDKELYELTKNPFLKNKLQ